MWVTDYAIETALLRVFRDFRVFHPGGSLLLSDIRRAWGRTGLRARDVEAGLALLVEGAFVAIDTGPDGEELVKLRPRGSERLTLLPRDLGELFEEMDALMILHAARRRRRTEFWHQMRQRLRGYAPPDAAAHRAGASPPSVPQLPPRRQ